MRVAARLAIPFVTLDAAAEYKRGVIDYLLAEYRAGRTPNPDVMCNREVKFGAFYKAAIAGGARYIATGHYLSGEKDQRYFLWAVPKEALERTIFPLAGYEKPAVRALAKRFGLPVAEKPDSQGICFLVPVSVEEFLRAEFGEVPGEALDQEGKVVGTHGGAALYTIGERASLPGGPWYVQAKDMARNTITVSHEHGCMQKAARIPFSQANWHKEPAGELDAQYRYRGPHVRGHIRVRGAASDIEGGVFEPAEALVEAPAPGQSVVFYKNDELVGGGIIAA